MRLPILMPLTLLLACGSTDPSDIWQAELDEARSRWGTAGLTGYSFHYTRNCFCPQLSIRVTVQGGQVTAIRDLIADTAYTSPLPDYTIPKLFDQIQDFIDRPVDRLTAGYDPVTGVPLSIAADPIRNAIDDENGFSVGEFESVP